MPILRHKALHLPAQGRSTIVEGIVVVQSRCGRLHEQVGQLRLGIHVIPLGALPVRQTDEPTPILAQVHHLASDHSEGDRVAPDLLERNGEVVALEQYEVRKLADLE
jgi:hypothetical protein